MIVVSEKRGKNLCFFPKNDRRVFLKYWIEIDDRGKKREIDVKDECCYDKWYSFLLDVSKYQNGEYKYNLFGDGELIGNGLIQVGEYNFEYKNFKNHKKITEYDG